MSGIKIALLISFASIVMWTAEASAQEFEITSGPTITGGATNTDPDVGSISGTLDLDDDGVSDGTWSLDLAASSTWP